MIRPPFLKSGDRVGIVAPSSWLKQEELEPGLDMIRSWGLEVVIGKHVFNHINSFAGTDEERVSDFQGMMDDDSIRAIICARGGYGAVRVVTRLDARTFNQHPKWIVGCSDITVIHAWLQHLGIESIHGEMPRFVPPAEPDLVSMDSVRAALFGETRKYALPSSGENLQGTAKGILRGGNLSVLYSLAGTEFEPPAENTILFIEDIGEYLYHIDRMLMNLEARKRLEKLKGMVAGTMNDMKVSGSGYRKPVEEIIREMVEKYRIPVMFGFPAGHAHPNLSLFLGREVELTVNRNQCTITF